MVDLFGKTSSFVGIVTIPTNDLVFPYRNHHAPTFQRTGIYRSVFFAQTVRD